MAKTVQNVVTWLKSWFYEKSEVYKKEETYSKGEVDTALGNKLNSNLTTANKNLVTSNTGNVILEDKPVVPTNTSSLVNDGESGTDTYVENGDLSTVATSGSYNDLSNKPTIPDVSGFIDTAGTGLSKSGTTLNHSNSVTAQSSAVFKKFSYDGQGHITGTANVTSSDLPNHNHYVEDITDDNVYTSISSTGTLDNTLDSIDTAIGNLQSIKAIEVVSTLPTASANTMNRLYIVSENSKVNVYYTEQSGSTYSWHKMDADILDELSIDWSDIDNNPFSSASPSDYASSTHSHGIITSDGKCDSTTINSRVSSFLGVHPTTKVIGRYSQLSAERITSNYAYSNIGTQADATQHAINSAINSNIGTINTSLSSKANTSDIPTDVSDLTDTNNTAFTPKSHTHGYLNDDGTITNIQTITSVNSAPIIADYMTLGKIRKGYVASDWIFDKNAHTNISTSASDSQTTVNTAIDTAIGSLQSNTITSIALVPKNTDANGKIIFYTGDEPT